MRILVINGSPKGDLSVTMQYILWLKYHYVGHHFEFLNVAADIRKYEQTQEIWDEFMEKVGRSDLIVFAFPLYFFLVHSAYKRFIELLYEKNAASYLTGKFAVAFSTSIHFYDHTAHQYVQEICEDLKMNFIAGFSAHMNDLHEKSKQRQLLQFFDHALSCHDANKVLHNNCVRNTSEVLKVEAAIRPMKAYRHNLKIRIVHDENDAGSNLIKMIEALATSFEPRAEIINICDIKIAGRCQGCLKCGLNNECVYASKDEFVKFFTNTMMSADVLFLAGRIKDRFLSSEWKNVMDRSFFKTHQPKFENIQIGFVISGDLKQNSNLKEVLRAYGELEGGNVLGFVSDDVSSDRELVENIDALAYTAVQYGMHGYVAPPTFRKIAGAKLFRDEVYADLRFIFSADHRYYKKNKWYNFPNQKHFVVLLMDVLRFLAWAVPPFKRQYQKMTVKGMIMPYRHLLKEAKQKSIGRPIE